MRANSFGANLHLFFTDYQNFTELWLIFSGYHWHREKYRIYLLSMWLKNIYFEYCKWYDEYLLPDWFRTSSLIFSRCWIDGILGMPKINPLQLIQCPETVVQIKITSVTNYWNGIDEDSSKLTPQNGMKKRMKFVLDANFTIPTFVCICLSPLSSISPPFEPLIRRSSWFYIIVNIYSPKASPNH